MQLSTVAGVVIAHEVAREVPKAAELCGRREAAILKVARSPDISLEALERGMAEAAAMKPTWHREGSSRSPDHAPFTKAAKASA